MLSESQRPVLGELADRSRSHVDGEHENVEAVQAAARQIGGRWARTDFAGVDCGTGTLLGLLGNVYGMLALFGDVATPARQT